MSACQKRLKREEGHSSTYFWTPAQEIYLGELKRQRLTKEDAHSEYEAKAAAEGWVSRSQKAVSEKMSTVNNRVLQEAQATLSGFTATQASRATGKKYEWTPEEDRMILESCGAGKSATACRQELLEAEDSQGPRIDAIRRRYKELASEKIRTVLQARGWGKKDDRRLEKEMKASDAVEGTAEEQEAVIQRIASELRARPTFVRRRWEWISQVGRKDIQYLNRGKDELATESQEIQARFIAGAVEEVEAADDEDLVIAGDGIPSCPPTPKEAEAPASKSIYDDEMWEALRAAAKVMEERAEEERVAKEREALAHALVTRLGELSADVGDALAAMEEIEGPMDTPTETTAPLTVDATDAQDDAVTSVEYVGESQPAQEPAITVEVEGEEVGDQDGPVDEDAYDSEEESACDDEADEDLEDLPEDEEVEAEEGEVFSDWKEDMRRFRLAYIDDKGKVKHANPHNLGRFMEYLVPTSNMGKDVERIRLYREECARAGVDCYLEVIPMSKGPTLTPSRVRLLMFVGALICPGRETREAFLRELWAGWYSSCKSGACGLEYDWDCHEFDHFGGCRHWDYYYYEEDHFDDFTSEDDYRLAAALVAHRLAGAATHHYKWETPADGWQYLSVDVGGYGPLTELFRAWPAKSRYIHALCILGRFSALLVTEEFMAVNGKDFGCRHGSYGRLYFGKKDRDGKAAMLMKLDSTWFFICVVSPECIADNLGDILWSPMTDIRQFLDRFAFMDARRLEPLPMLTKFAFRDYSWEPKSSTGGRSPEVIRVYKGFKDYLNKKQGSVLDTVLTQKGIILNRGPYGCGKTTLIASCATVYALMFPQERVLIVSETNAAVDEDLERIIEMGVLPTEAVVRVGGLSERMEGYRDHYLLDRLDRQEQELEASGVPGREIGQVLTQLRQRILGSARIMVTTLGQMPKKWMREVPFHLVINDEAGQTLETSLLLSLSVTVHTVLAVGDENQLRGHVPLEEELREHYGRNRKLHKLTWSLLHSMTEAARQNIGRTGAKFDIRRHFPGITSTVEYRSNQRITDWLQVFYDYDLKCEAKESACYLSQMSLPAGNGNMGQERVAWFGLERADRCRPEVENQPELQMSVELVLRAKVAAKREGMTKKKSVFIISPYKRQVRLFKRIVRELSYLWVNYFDVEVMTTDASQGREADIVIVSMVRQHTMGFLRGYPARSLVSLSRPRDYLFLAAKLEVFRYDEYWQKLRVRADKLGVRYMPVNWTTSRAKRCLQDTSYLEWLAYDDEDEDEDGDVRMRNSREW